MAQDGTSETGGMRSALRPSWLGKICGERLAAARQSGRAGLAAVGLARLTGINCEAVDAMPAVAK